MNKLVDNVNKMKELEKDNLDALSYSIKAMMDSNPNTIFVNKIEMGDTTSYVGSLSLKQFAEIAIFARELPLMEKMVVIEPKTGRPSLKRDPKSLNDLTQREIDHKREAALVDYLLDDRRKFPTALCVITADWVDPKDSYDQNYWHEGINPKAKQDSCNYTALTPDMGLLKLDENFRIYALDGQHRLLGIKRLKELAEQGRVTLNYTTKKELSKDFPGIETTDLRKILSERISVEFVIGVKKGETRSEAKERVRTLFVDINDEQKRLSKAAGAALKDSGYTALIKQIMTRDSFVDLRGINKDKVGEIDVTNLKATNPTDGSQEFTTLDILARMAEALFEKKGDLGRSFTKSETKELIEDHEDTFLEFLQHMKKMKCIDAYLNASNITAMHLRLYSKKSIPNTEPKQYGEGNILFRRVGQIVFARAIGAILQKNPETNLKEVFKKVYKFEARGGFSKIDNPESIFHMVLFDRNRNRMLVNETAIELASKLIQYVLVQNLTNDEREDLRQHLIEKRIVKSEEGERILDYSGKYLTFNRSNPDDEDSVITKYESEFKLPETV